jgi:hypothetical protein
MCGRPVLESHSVHSAFHASVCKQQVKHSLVMNTWFFSSDSPLSAQLKVVAHLTEALALMGMGRQVFCAHGQH